MVVGFENGVDVVPILVVVGFEIVVVGFENGENVGFLENVVVVVEHVVVLENVWLLASLEKIGMGVLASLEKVVLVASGKVRLAVKYFVAHHQCRNAAHSLGFSSGC